MKEAGVNGAELARLAKTSRQQIKRLRDGDRGLSQDWARRLAPVLRTTPEKLMFGPRKANAAGYIGGGGEVYPIDDYAVGDGLELEPIDIPPGVPDDAVLVIVRGDSMHPRYFDNEYLFYLRDDRPPVEFVGRECVVKLTDGRAFVKILRPGSRPDLFNLESWNPTTPTMIDAVLEWAAPVMARVNRGSRR